MPGSRWFSHVDMEASYPSEPVALEALERVLNAARPGNVDPAGSSAVDGFFTIAHTADRTADIYIEVNEDWAALDCMIISQEFRAGVEPEWIQALALALDQVIRGQYVIERTRLKNKIIRTAVSTQGLSRQTASTCGRLPIPERFLTRERIELDYGCHPL